MFVVLLALVMQMVFAQWPLPRSIKYNLNRLAISTIDLPDQNPIDIGIRKLVPEKKRKSGTVPVRVQRKEVVLEPSGDVLTVQFLVMFDTTPMVILLKLNDEIIYDAVNATNTFYGNDPNKSLFIMDADDYEYFLRISQNNNWNTRIQALTGSETESCGTVKVQRTPLITYGESTSEGEWPWHVAIYRSGDLKCGGSLISHKHVLTAAHCVTYRYTDIEILNKKILQIYLGKHSLNTQNEHVQNRSVSRIIIHPDYHYKHSNNDIAIVELDRVIEYTDYVRPVCLWEEDENVDTIVGRYGTVVGWGKDQTGNVSENLMQAVMPVVSTDVCKRMGYKYFSYFTLDKIFCGDVINGTAACNRDSGGGMVFPKTGPGNILIWQLRGVLFGNSNSLVKCHRAAYNFFTDVAKYLNWIKPIIQ